MKEKLTVAHSVKEGRKPISVAHTHANMRTDTHRHRHPHMHERTHTHTNTFDKRRVQMGSK